MVVLLMCSGHETRKKYRNSYNMHTNEMFFCGQESGRNDKLIQRGALAFFREKSTQVPWFVGVVRGVDDFNMENDDVPGRKYKLTLCPVPELALTEEEYNNMSAAYDKAGGNKTNGSRWLCRCAAWRYLRLCEIPPNNGCFSGGIIQLNIELPKEVRGYMQSALEAADNAAIAGVAAAVAATRNASVAASLATRSKDSTIIDAINSAIIATNHAAFVDAFHVEMQARNV